MAVGSPAFDIATLLIQEGVGKAGVNHDDPSITVGFEREDRRLLMTIFDTGGPESNPAWGRDYPRIQIRTKAKDPYGYDEAYRLQQVTKDVLLGRPRQIINGTLYVGFWQQGDIQSLGMDRDNRPILVANYRLVREYGTPFRKEIE